MDWFQVSVFMYDKDPSCTRVCPSWNSSLNSLPQSLHSQTLSQDIFLDVIIKRNAISGLLQRNSEEQLEVSATKRTCFIDLTIVKNISSMSNVWQV